MFWRNFFHINQDLRRNELTTCLINLRAVRQKRKGIQNAGFNGKKG